jgi:hypothetical protein
MNKDLSFLEDLGFDKAYMTEMTDIFPDTVKDIIVENKETVIDNVNYLKNLGISNYQDAFIRFYNMFLIEPSSFDDIFSKYDKEDLIAKLEKNIAIMEHL